LLIGCAELRVSRRETVPEHHDITDIGMIPMARLADEALKLLREEVATESHEAEKYQLVNFNSTDWEKLIKEEERTHMISDAEEFLDGARIVAKNMRRLLEDRDSVPGSDAIGFIADGGLEKNIDAAKIARTEYRQFLRTRKSKDDVIDQMISFYEKLSYIFRKEGVL
jgi:hypothetical protein